MTSWGVLGFKRTVEPGVEDNGVSTENAFSSDFCWDGGMLGLEDETVDGAYRMYHSWALDHALASQAVSGLRRLHQHLKDNGWEVTPYREGGKGKDWDLFVQRDDGDERMSFIWYSDREYFTGGASVPQLVAIDRAGPRLPRWFSRHQGSGGEPASVSRGQGDRLMTRLDAQAGKYRHPRLLCGRGRDLLDRIRQHRTLQHRNRQTWHVSQRGLDECSLLLRRYRVPNDLRDMLIQQPGCLVSPGVEDSLDSSEGTAISRS